MIFFELTGTSCTGCYEMMFSPPAAQTKLFQKNLNMPSCRGWKANEGILFLWNFILIQLSYRNDHPSAYFFYSKSDKMNRPQLSDVKIKFHKNKRRSLVFLPLQDGILRMFWKSLVLAAEVGEHIISQHAVQILHVSFGVLCKSHCKSGFIIL